MRLGRIFISIIMLLGFSLVLLNPAMAQPVVLKFPHEAPDTTIKGKTINLFADLVKKHSKDSLRIEVYPGAQLIPGREEVRAAIRGQVQIIAPQTSYFSSLDPVFDVFYQPLLLNDYNQGMKLLAGPFGRELLARFSKVGLIGLGMWHDGPGYLFVKGEPIRSLNDIRGKRFVFFHPLHWRMDCVMSAPYQSHFRQGTSFWRCSKVSLMGLSLR